jgi:hypothetical protein
MHKPKRVTDSRPVMVRCIVCTVQYERTRLSCPGCDTPNPAHAVVEKISLTVEIPVEVFRSLVSAANGKDSSPNVIVIEAIEEWLTKRK